MITYQKCFVANGKSFPTLEEAQREEIQMIPTTSVVAEFILANKDKILDILTTTEASRPRARKVNGGTKTRKKTAQPEQPETKAA